MLISYPLGNLRNGAIGYLAGLGYLLLIRF